MLNFKENKEIFFFVKNKRKETHSLKELQNEKQLKHSARVKTGKLNLKGEPSLSYLKFLIPKKSFSHLPCSENSKFRP